MSSYSEKLLINCVYTDRVGCMCIIYFLDSKCDTFSLLANTHGPQNRFQGCVSVSPLRVGQFDRYDMCIDIFWSISDVSYDTILVTVLHKPIFFPGILIQTLNHTTIWDWGPIHCASFVIPNVRNCDPTWWMYADQEGRFKFFSRREIS